MKRRRALESCLSICLILFATGCWSGREVQDLAIITSVGIDRISEDGIDQWQVSARMIQSTITTGGGGAPSGSSQEVLMQGKGITIEDAVGDVAKRLPRQPFYAHASTAIVGEKAAREKTEDVLEVLTRFVEMRFRVNLLVARGDAFSILQTEPEMAKTNSKESKSMAADTAKLAGLSGSVNLSEFAQWLLSPDRDAVLPEIKVIRPQEKSEASVSKTQVVEGLGVFRGARLVGWLNRQETQGYLFLTQKLSGVEIRLPVTKGGRCFTYFIHKTKSRIEPQLTGDKLAYLIRIETAGAIIDSNGLDLTAETMPEVEADCAGSIRELALRTIRQAKEYNSDFLGCSEKLHRSEPAVWREIAPHWRESFRAADIEVEVTAKVLNTGKLGRKMELKQ